MSAFNATFNYNCGHSETFNGISVRDAVRLYHMLMKLRGSMCLKCWEEQHEAIQNRTEGNVTAILRCGR